MQSCLDNLPQQKVEKSLSIFIKDKLDKNEMVCRNACQEFVRCEINTKFEWDVEWFERFCNRYDFTNEEFNLRLEE